MKKKILFVTHEASKTGAPIVLLNLLKWLKNNRSYEIFVYVKRPGDLNSHFEEVGITYYPLKNVESKSVFLRFGKKVLVKLFPSLNKSNQIPGALLKHKFDLIYLNSIDTLDLAPFFNNKFDCPIINHVHENEYVSKYYYSHYKSEIQLINRFIAVSISTKNNLIETYNIDANNIDLVYESIPIKEVQSPTSDILKIKRNLNIAEGEFIVGAAGTTNWRKGTDLFVQLAMTINNLRPNNKIKFLWLGEITHEFKSQFLYESARMGLEDQVLFVGSKKNAHDYFQLFDVFVLTSREDPFPLVVLETASLSKPIICFDKSGGIPELIKNGIGGITVPYGDLIAMANAIFSLCDSDINRKTMGFDASKLVEQYDTSLAGKEIAKIIDQISN